MFSPDSNKCYCREFFVSKGMIADFAIHDKGDGNPHAHILLTIRAMDETGKWLPKSRKVYDLDENGERIRLPSGNWKSHKEDTVDWNDQKYGEISGNGWRTQNGSAASASPRTRLIRKSPRSMTYEPKQKMASGMGVLPGRERQTQV